MNKNSKTTKLKEKIPEKKKVEIEEKEDSEVELPLSESEEEQLKPKLSGNRAKSETSKVPAKSVPPKKLNLNLNPKRIKSLTLVESLLENLSKTQKRSAMRNKRGQISSDLQKENKKLKKYAAGMATKYKNLFKKNTKLRDQLKQYKKRVRRFSEELKDINMSIESKDQDYIPWVAIGLDYI